MDDTKMDRTIVDTSSGRLRGLVERDVVVFRGVPYARPPVGPLRFRTKCYNPTMIATVLAVLMALPAPAQTVPAASPTSSSSCKTP